VEEEVKEGLLVLLVWRAGRRGGAVAVCRFRKHRRKETNNNKSESAERGGGWGDEDVLPDA